MSKVTQGLSVVQTQINNIKGLMASKQDVPFCDYRVMRETLNVFIIQVVFGCTIKGQNKVAFNRPLPTMSDLSKLHIMMKDYCDTVENPYIQQCNIKLEEDVNSNIMPIETGGVIPKFDKIKKKNVVNAMIGAGADCIMHLMFTPDQLLEMSALAEQLRRKIRRDQIIIIAGITLAVTAAAVGGYCAYKHYKNDDDVDDIVDDAGYDNIDDIPHVDIDDDLG